MSDPKGPKVELPEDLAAQIEEPEPAADAEDAGAAAAAPPDAPPDAPPEAPPDAPSEGGEDGEASEAGSEAMDPARELEEAKDRHLRLAAEFDNFRRRTLKERHELLTYSNESLIKELLPTVDNLERALEHAQNTEEGDDVEKFLEGVELTYRSLMRVLEQAGLKRVESENASFDPELHQAIRQVSAEGREPGAIVETLQRGYRLKDRLIRPALVVVAGSPQGDSE